MKKVQSSSLFLMELIISIFFFVVCSAFCLSIFVKAHLLSVKAQDLNASALEVSNVADTIRASSSLDSLESLFNLEYPKGEWGYQCFLIYYNDAFEECHREEATYILEVKMTAEENDIQANLTMTKENVEVTSLDVHHHWKGSV